MKKGLCDITFQRASILQLTLSVGPSVMQSFYIKVYIFSFLLFFLFSLFMTTEHLLDNSVFSCQSIHGFNLIYRNPGPQFSATLLSTPCKF